MTLNSNEYKELKEFISNSRIDYKEQWKIDSTTINNRGHYDWMASFITSHNFVLEIGTGTGYSTLKLLDNGHKVIGIDENLECLIEAYELLTSQGKNVTLITRENLSSELNNSKYIINYSSFDIDINQYDGILIEADILNKKDEFLSSWLNSLGGFDAIVCWLIGSHSARPFNESMPAWVKGNPFYYRISVQNEVYELADIILKNNGLLHLVDRSPEINEKIKEEIIKSHKEQASVTTLEFISIDTIDYGLIDTNGVGMVSVNYLEKSTDIDYPKSQFLTSILNKKP